MKYSWFIFFLALQGCDDSEELKELEESQQINVITVDANGEELNVDVVDWSQDISPEISNKLACEGDAVDCSKRPFDSNVIGTIHFKVDFHQAKGDYCAEYFSGEEFVDLNGSNQDITITVYYDAIACE